MNQPSCVVSLNYDVLIEQISTIAKEGFDYRDLYTTVVASALSRKGTGMIGKYPQEQSLILYKLHGSINWCYSGSESFFGESIYDVGLIPFSSDSSLATRDRRSEIEKSSNDKVPLIVPPTLHKETFFKNEFVKTQWRSSFENLSKCGEIFCLGYSLPKSDLMMRFYLSQVLKSPLVNKLFIVDRNTDTISNYREAFRDYESKLDFSLVKDGEPIREIFKFSPVAEKKGLS